MRTRAGSLLESPPTMQTKTLLLVGAAGLLMLTMGRARASTIVVAGAPRQDYPSPSAIAAASAGRVLEGLFAGFRNTPTPGAVANAAAREDAREAVRAGDSYYGLGSIAWYAGNTEAAREAVRAGDSYYTGPAAIVDAWTVDNSAYAY